jgi:hypothetical protein
MRRGGQFAAIGYGWPAGALERRRRALRYQGQGDPLRCLLQSRHPVRLPALRGGRPAGSRHAVAQVYHLGDTRSKSDTRSKKDGALQLIN